MSILDHFFGAMSYSLDLALVVGNFSNQGLMLLDQVLHADEVTTTVGGSSNLNIELFMIDIVFYLFFLSDPGQFILDITEKLVTLKRLGQLVLPLLQRIIE